MRLRGLGQAGAYAKRISVRLITLGLSVLMMGASSGFRDWHWNFPAWVPEPVVPLDNPMSVAKVELGRHLFYDPRLSADYSLTCASCHEQARAFTDGKALSRGVNGEPGVRSAMSLANVAYLPALTWQNPDLVSLEVQSLIPLFGEHPVEMGMAGREEELFNRLRADPLYRQLFAAAFPDGSAGKSQDAPISLATITRALAAFQRSLVSVHSPWDRYRYGGESKAISESARRGEALFFGERLECYHCHGGLHFTDNIKHKRLPDGERGFHNTGLYNIDGTGSYPPESPGIAELTDLPEDRGVFRTPSLRNIAVTAPYMHDGSIATLEEVIRDHYAIGGRATRSRHGANPMRSPFIAGFSINDDEVRDVVAFLESLTDEQFLRDPRFGNPWRVAKP
jgi:cytochrome c peroxidase